MGFLFVVVWVPVISGGWYWQGGHRGVHFFAFVLVTWIFFCWFCFIFVWGGFGGIFSWFVLFLCFVGRWLLFLLLGLLVGFFGFWLVVFAFVCSGLGFFFVV